MHAFKAVLYCTVYDRTAWTINSNEYWYLKVVGNEKEEGSGRWKMLSFLAYFVVIDVILSLKLFANLE